MTTFELWRVCNLGQPVKVEYLDGNFFSLDNEGNLFGVEVFNPDGTPAELSGTVSANAVRCDGETVAIGPGTIHGNRAFVAIKQAALVKPGPVVISLKISDGTQITTLYCLIANVYPTSTDTPVDPGEIIPSIADLIEEIEAAVAAIPSDYSDLSKNVERLNDTTKEGNISYLSLENDFTYLDNTLTESENSVISVTDYIPIPSDARAVEISTKTVFNGVETYILPLVFFFDDSKNYISRDSNQSSNIASFPIPMNAKYIRVNQPSSSVTSTIPRLIRFVYGTLGYSAIIDSTYDANTLSKPGVYWFAYNNKPAHLPDEITESGRILVIKSETLTNYGAAWQLICNNDGFFYRPCLNSAGTNWANWNKVQRMKSAMGFKRILTNADSFRTIDENGMYQYDTSSVPTDAPSKIGGRTLVVKGTTDGSHYLEAQMQIIDGVFYYRSTADAQSRLQDWKSLGLGSPMYQTEELPYNAVLYHQKWSGWGGSGRTRTEKTILLGYVDNDETLPIYAYQLSLSRNFCNAEEHFVDYNWTNAPYKRPKILIIGGVHGNEKCTPMDIWRIAQALKSRDYNDIAVKFDWFFVPLVNPWGYSHCHLDSNGNIIYDNATENVAQTVECTAELNAGIRNNGHNMNINRDWSDNTFTLDGKTYGFQTPELQLLLPYVLSVQPDVFIDAHQNHSDRSFSTDPMCCYNRPYHTTPVNAEVLKLMRAMDIANANTDQIMHRFCKNTRTVHQTCRFSMMPTELYAQSNAYMAGLSWTRGGVVRGNTAHPELAIDHSVLTETSEICYSFNGGSDTWYNPWACTFSCTYLWEMLKQIANLY